MKKLITTVMVVAALWLHSGNARACYNYFVFDHNYGSQAAATTSCQSSDAIGTVASTLAYRGGQLYLNYGCSGNVSACGFSNSSGTTWQNDADGPVGDDSYFMFAYQDDGTLFGWYVACANGQCFNGPQIYP